MTVLTWQGDSGPRLVEEKACMPRAFERCRGWLPTGKRAAICFSVDDVHPATSRDEFDAGGDLGRGALGRFERLLRRNPQLRATLFVTPDWRLKRLVPTRPWLDRVPVLRKRIYWASVHRKGHFRVDRFPAFVAYLNSLPRTEIALHGLTHAHPGPRMAVEFQEQSRRTCSALLKEARQILATAGLRHVPGFQPPAWDAPPALCEALSDADFHFVSSARDLHTPVSCEAQTAMSGLHGASLIEPMWIRCRVGTDAATATTESGGLVHLTSNFQATSTLERAREIVEAGGLLSIKAHIFKAGGGITMLDGLDDEYCRYLDHVCQELDRHYGERLWWTSLAEVAGRCRSMRS
jgi:predicted deacetylase